MTLGEIELVIAKDSRHWALEFAALEQLLALCQSEEGVLDDRVLALPDREFASATALMYALGWIEPTKEE
jgi:hypothetical protein